MSCRFPWRPALGLPLVLIAAAVATPDQPQSPQPQSPPPVPPKIALNERPLEGAETPRRRGVIEFRLGDTTYRVFPTDPLNPLRDKHFTIQAPVHVTAVDYDATKRFLTVSVALASNEQVEAELKKELVKYFAREGNTTLKPDQISFGSFTTRGYKLELMLPDGTLVTLKAVKPEEKADVTVNATTIVYQVKPEEATLHELLIRQKRAVDLVATMYVEGERVLSAEARVTLLQGAWKRAMEKVLPDSNIPPEKWAEIKYVTRDALTKLEQAMRTEVVASVQFNGLDSASLLDPLTAFVTQQFQAAPKLSAEDLRRIPEQEQIWTRTLGAKEIEPSVREGFTTKVKEMNATVASVDTSAKLLHEHAEKERDASKFRRWAKKELKIEGEASACFGLFGAEFKMDKRDEELTDSDYDRIRETMGRLNTESAWKQYLSTNSSRYWEGKMNEYLTTAKVYSLHRVSDSNFTAEWAAKFDVVRTLPIGLIPMKTVVQLNADPHVKLLERSKFAELEGRLEAWETKLATREEKLSATIKTLEGRLDAAEKANANAAAAHIQEIRKLADAIPTAKVYYADLEPRFKPVDIYDSKKFGRMYKYKVEFPTAVDFVTFSAAGGFGDQYGYYEIVKTDDPKVYWVEFQAKNQDPTAKTAIASGTLVGLKVK